MQEEAVDTKDTRWELIVVRLVIGAITIGGAWIEIKGNATFFSELTRLIAIILVIVGGVIGVAGAVLSYSKKPAVVSASLKGESIALLATWVIISVWYFAAGDYEAAQKLELAHAAKVGKYEADLLKGEIKYKEDLAIYERQMKSVEDCRGKDLTGFKFKSQVISQCGSIPSAPDRARDIYQPKERLGSAPTETAEQVAYRWKKPIRIVNVIILGIFVAIAVRLIWLLSRFIKEAVSNEKGKLVETSLPLSPLEEVSPSPPEDVKKESEAVEIKAPKVTQQMGDQGSNPNSPMGDPDSPKDVQPVTHGATQESQAVTEEPVNPIACYEGTYAICNERYALRKRKGHGWDLRYRGKPPEGQKPDIGYLGDSEGRSLVEASPEHQEFLMAGILRKKGKGDRPALAKRAAG